jgi:hypothetical protein
VINNILAASTIGAPEPEVGMGATLLMWSDRLPYTIVGVERFKSGACAGQVKAVLAQRDDTQRVDRNGMSESQEYVFLPNPNRSVERFALRKSGRFEGNGGTLAIGYRDKFFDFSF